MPLLLLLLLLPLLPSAAVAGKAHRAPASFALDFFPGDGAIAQLALTGANATSAGAISMRAPRARVQYRSPIRLAAQAGFSTYFSFSFSPRPGPKSRASLAFFLAPAAPPGPAASALSVAFHAADPGSVRVQVGFAGETAGLSTGLPAGARRLHSWIQYNATSATLLVGISASGPHGVPGSQLSRPLDFSTLLRGGGGRNNNNKKLVLAGFASSHANCTLFSWAFRAIDGPPYLMHSQPLDPAALRLATPPPDRLRRAAPSSSYHWVSLLLAAAAGAALTFFVLFVWYSMGARRPVAPVEYPMHPSSDDVVYEKIVLVGVKDAPAHAASSVGNNK